MKIQETWLSNLKSGARGFWTVCSMEAWCLSKQEKQRLILNLMGADPGHSPHAISLPAPSTCPGISSLARRMG